MHPPSILLVEDEQPLREFLAFALERQGYHVIAVEDGVQADRWLAEQLPDLALVDMMMPGASGFLVTRLVKERSDERVPVVMMSGNTGEAHRHYAFASGADSFLQKPFTPTALLEAVHALCPLPCRAAPMGRALAS